MRFLISPDLVYRQKISDRQPAINTRRTIISRIHCSGIVVSYKYFRRTDYVRPSVICIGKCVIVDISFILLISIFVYLRRTQHFQQLFSVHITAARFARYSQRIVTIATMYSAYNCASVYTLYNSICIYINYITYKNKREESCSS